MRGPRWAGRLSEQTLGYFAICNSLLSAAWGNCALDARARDEQLSRVWNVLGQTRATKRLAPLKVRASGAVVHETPERLVLELRARQMFRTAVGPFSSLSKQNLS